MIVTCVIHLVQHHLEDVFYFIRTYINTVMPIEFSLSQAHSFLFVYWSINYAERVTNKRVVLLLASVKISILGMPPLKNQSQFSCTWIFKALSHFQFDIK